MSKARNEREMLCGLGIEEFGSHNIFIDATR